jgi:chemotaxis protein MotB
MQMKTENQQRSIKIRTKRLLAILGVALLVLSGCVSSGTYESMVQERDQIAAEKEQLAAEKEQLAAERQALEGEKAALSAQLDEISQQKEKAAMEAEAAQAELDRQQQVYDNLQATFAKEQQANQVKIEMMKSGVKVNLANEILFPSGSAELNAQGQEVLTRAAVELKTSPYQTIVAGFTDDVAISGKLQEKYPTNWELAGARAASVVRLLEKEGVPSAQLLAISFGENSPVAPNDTPEGRSKNRRIEIILRPVAVTMN